MNIPKSTLEVRRCCAEEGAPRSLDGMQILCNKAIGSVCATDGKCILIGTWDRPSAWGSADVGDDFDVVVEKTDIDRVARNIPRETQDVTVCKSPKRRSDHIEFATHDCMQEVRTIEDKLFPNTEGIIPHYDDENSTAFTVNIEILAKLVGALAAALEHEDSQTVILEIPHKQGRPMKVRSPQVNIVQYVGAVMPCKGEG